MYLHSFLQKPILQISFHETVAAVNLNLIFCNDQWRQKIFHWWNLVLRRSTKLLRGGGKSWDLEGVNRSWITLHISSAISDSFRYQDERVSIMGICLTNISPISWDQQDDNEMHNKWWGSRKVITLFGLFNRKSEIDEKKWCTNRSDQD